MSQRRQGTVVVAAVFVLQDCSFYKQLCQQVHIFQFVNYITLHSEQQRLCRKARVFLIDYVLCSEVQVTSSGIKRLFIKLIIFRIKLSQTIVP